MSAYLIVFLLASTGSGWSQYAFPMPSMEACQESVATGKVEIPAGGDAEAAVAMVCVKSLDDGYQSVNGGQWFKREVEGTE